MSEGVFFRSLRQRVEGQAALDEGSCKPERAERAELRRRALARATELGWPGSRDEAYKYTSLTKLGSVPFGNSDFAGIDDRELSHLPEGPLIWALGGQVMPSRARLDDLPAGIRVKGDDEAMTELHEQLAVDASSDFLGALSAATIQGAVVVDVDANTEVDVPLTVAFLAPRPSMGADHQSQAPRLLVRLAENASLRLLEWHDGTSARCLSHPLIHVELAAGASFEHLRLLEDGPNTEHLGRIRVEQARDSRYRLWNLALRGSLSRSEIEVALREPGAECELDGLSTARGKEHRDQHVLVHHAVPHGTSRQTFKSVLADRGRGIFTGKVQVDPQAQKTSAEQSNRSLLLSETALAETRPQLEIHADDVTCSHGATIGRLRDDALFYLRSRGIGTDEAKLMLTTAFAAEVTESLPEGPWRELAESRVRERLATLLQEEEQAS
ncbi:MAG: Fe-S cluster assembly protein SufD [Acidobacteriota bacterium]